MFSGKYFVWGEKESVFCGIKGCMLLSESMHPFEIIFCRMRQSLVCLISVGEIFHELRAFIHRRIGDVGIV